MDFLDLLGSVNKISIFFFIVTLGVLGYEFYLFQKEKRRKEKPTIPTFNAAQKIPRQNYSTSPVLNEKPKVLKKHKNLALIITLVIVVFLGVGLFFTIQNTSTPQEQPPPVSTKAQTNPTSVPSPIITEQAALFITPTPTQTVLAQNPTASPSPSLVPSLAVGGVLNPTSTPSAGTTSIQPSITPSSSPTATRTVTTLPVAGVAQPQLFILALGALTVFFSILY